MIRCVVVFVILLVTSGCQTIRYGGLIHPDSKVLTPTFCLYDRSETDPHAIHEVQVYQRAMNDDNRSKEVWVLEYAPQPDEQFVRALRAYSCITYGEVPSGYKQKAPALPLIPERSYSVSLKGKDYLRDSLNFVIRLGPSGEPIKLESVDGWNTIVTTPP